MSKTVDTSAEAVERLAARLARGETEVCSDALNDEAAASLHALAAERDAEAKRAVVFEEANEKVHDRLWAVEAGRDRLAAENSRLREALTTLVDAVAACQDDHSLIAGMRLGAAHDAALFVLAQEPQA